MKSYVKHIRGNDVFLYRMTDAERKDYFADEQKKDPFPPKSTGVTSFGGEPRYVQGRGGNTYSVEFIQMFPYTYGR